MKMDHHSIKTQMVKFLQDQATSIGVQNVVIGISGGLDSAIVSILCKEAFGDKVHGVLLPSQYSSDSSIEDAKELCEKFSIKYETISIAPMVEGYFKNNESNASALRKGNFSARMRMAVLYDISAKYNAIVVGTSNKSEILLGYGTLYGDTACAINPIGQMYKSDEFEFGRFLGVPETILEKKPSADLWEGQSDEEELGYSYKMMDDVLKQLVDQQVPKQHLIDQGVDKKLIEMLEHRMKANAFKGKLPIIANIDFVK
jgi:NAD+ synthase